MFDILSYGDEVTFFSNTKMFENCVILRIVNKVCYRNTACSHSMRGASNSIDVHFMKVCDQWLKSKIHCDGSENSHKSCGKNTLQGYHK